MSCSSVEVDFRANKSLKKLTWIVFHPSIAPQYTSVILFVVNNTKLEHLIYYILGFCDDCRILFIVPYLAYCFYKSIKVIKSVLWKHNFFYSPTPDKTSRGVQCKKFLHFEVFLCDPMQIGLKVERRVLCRDHNLSPPIAACINRQITFGENRK